jgi:hypothetical protein
MSHFYGVIQGNRGDATRGGSKGSGLTATAASWAGAITVELAHNELTGKDTFSVWQKKWHGKGINGFAPLAEGVIGEQDSAEYSALDLSRMIVEWAAESRDHGGNPYMLDFVVAAQHIIDRG